MKAMYEITFYSRVDPTQATDVRRIVKPATSRGCREALTWAIDHEDKEEFVGAVRIIASEAL